MSFRAIGSLLTRRRFSIPTTAPARSLHSSLRDLAHGRRRAAAVAAVAFAGVGAGALQYFKKGTGHDDSADRQGDFMIDNGVITWELDKPGMKKRFQRLIKTVSRGYKAYRDDQELLRFAKADLERMESLPPCDCDKHLRMMCCPHGIDQTECDDLFMEFFAMYEKEPREELDKLGPDDIAKSIMAIYEKKSLH